MIMRHGSLFSGIGGFDLAAEWMGWTNVFHCENNTFCQKILKYYWPDAKSYGDITKTDFTEWRGKIDIISGGFPCQPYSVAGKRKGKDDDRHLWPEMLRAIREIQPRWVVGENVPGLLNWERGMVLDEIKADLETTGFEVLPPLILPACGKNAPHRRDRMWLIANSSGFQWNSKREEGQQCTFGWQSCGVSDGVSKQRVFTNSNSNRLQGEGGVKERLPIEFKTFDHKGNWKPISEPGIFRGNDGVSNRMDRTKSLGNAVVPQVAYEIFKAIEQTDK